MVRRPPNDPSQKGFLLLSQEEAARAREDRDEGMGRSEDGAGTEWVDYAYDFIVAYCVRNETMHVDDLWRDGLSKPASSRALGVAVKRAVTKGVIEQSRYGSDVICRASVRSNMQMKPVWRSLLYEEERA